MFLLSLLVGAVFGSSPAPPRADPPGRAAASLSSVNRLPAPAGKPFHALVRRRQEVEWYRSGSYIGVQVGAMNANASASDLDRDLSGRGYVTQSSLDDTDAGFKIYGGYRFESPWALELGYVDLGTVESSVSATPVNPTQFLADLADLHPFAGRGVTAAAEYFMIDRPQIDFGLRAGLWAWSSDTDARAAGGLRVDVDESGVDPFVGADFLVRLSGRTSLRVQYEKYWLDGDDVDFVSLGLQLALYR